MPLTPYIPETITVHLGAPDSDAPNVTVPFVDYIANVASSEVYPTWPESAIRANIYAQISYTLNRIYTEYYRARGYDFDITNSTAIDQSFVYGRDIFENINRIASEVFTDYIRRQGSIEPLFAQYCDGINVQCPGLSQWGSVDLAQQGLGPYDILTYYYGDNIDLVTDAPVMGITSSVPDRPLELGSAGGDVRQIQVRLNRIARNYPSIPKIAVVDGLFSYDTENAIRAFQEIFGLTPDGIVGRATWYKIQLIYNSVKRLSELNSEGITQNDITDVYYEFPNYGDTGAGVRNLQYYLDYLSRFYSTIPPVDMDGVLGDKTRDAVLALQRTFGLTEDGIVGYNTWYTMLDAYYGVLDQLAGTFTEGDIIPFPGVIIRLGAESDVVALMQRYLNRIAEAYPDIPTVNPTGYFGNMTEEAVTAFQRLFGLPENGIVDAATWDEIMNIYSDLENPSPREGQFPGSDLGA